MPYHQPFPGSSVCPVCKPCHRCSCECVPTRLQVLSYHFRSYTRSSWIASSVCMPPFGVRVVHTCRIGTHRCRCKLRLWHCASSSCRTLTGRTANLLSYLNEISTLCTYLYAHIPAQSKSGGTVTLYRALKRVSISPVRNSRCWCAGCNSEGLTSCKKRSRMNVKSIFVKRNYFIHSYARSVSVSLANGQCKTVPIHTLTTQASIMRRVHFGSKNNKIKRKYTYNRTTSSFIALQVNLSLTKPQPFVCSSSLAECPHSEQHATQPIR